MIGLGNKILFICGASDKVPVLTVILAVVILDEMFML